MSTTTRSTPRGGKNTKVETTQSTPKTQKTDQNKLNESPKTVGLDKTPAVSMLCNIYLQ